MTLAHKTKLSALAVALLVAAATLLVPPTTASADTGSFTVAGTLHLSAGLISTTDAAGCFGGVATGIHGDDASAGHQAFAGFTYNNPNIIFGDATGNLEVYGTDVPTQTVTSFEQGFDWFRTGAVVMVAFSGRKSGHTGFGVGELAPVDAALFDCHPARTDKNYWHGLWPADEHLQIVAEIVLQ